MRKKLTGIGCRLLSAVFILVLTGFITLFAATETGMPEHTLTYYGKGVMNWDSGVDHNDGNGSAIFNLFNFCYNDVMSENGDKVIAPGTNGAVSIRLSNRGSHPITYTAVFYLMKTRDEIPIETVVQAESSTDGKMNPLPAGVTKKDVIRTVSGTVDNGNAHDFNISWLWKFDEGAKQDVIDTMLGDMAAQGEDLQADVGMYVVVEEEEDNKIGGTGAAHTGDVLSPETYAIAAAVSIAAMAVLLLCRRKEEK